MPSEFEIIRQYFSSTENRDDVVLGIGDDAAILEVPEGCQLVQSVDTLVAGVHFPFETSPEDIAYKSLAVNLSDMAAMGAEPAWFTLAITLPDDDESWLKAFSMQLAELAQQHNVQLVGGDTTHGSLSVSITINGFVPFNKALTRRKANVGDQVYVSGSLGDAALALAAWQGECLLLEDTKHALDLKLNRPEAQLELGLQLRDIASSCIDISDGLLADLGHICDNSNVAANIDIEKIPLSQEFKKNITDETLMYSLSLSGGDDYQLCFTIPENRQSLFEKNLRDCKISVTCIGEIVTGTGVHCFRKNKEIDIEETGYQHFSGE